MVEVDGADIVKVADKCKQATPQLEVEHLDLVIVSAGDKKRLRRVEMHPSHRPFMLIVAVDERPNADVPHLDRAIMQTCKDPRTSRMKCNTLHTITLALKLDQHDETDARADEGTRVGTETGLAASAQQADGIAPCGSQALTSTGAAHRAADLCNFVTLSCDAT